jgi:hypothetical protein
VLFRHCLLDLIRDHSLDGRGRYPLVNAFLFEKVIEAAANAFMFDFHCWLSFNRLKAKSISLAGVPIRFPETYLDGNVGDAGTGF